MRKKTWNIKEQNENLIKILTAQKNISPLMAKVLASRGFDNIDDVNEFLNKDNLVFHDPFLMKDMDLAVARINKALSDNESICIYGDYDVDGVTSTMMLYDYLTSKGGKCSYYIPERLTQGYGLSKEAIEKIAAEDINLIITVDTGITAVDEATFAKEIGVDLIITDHHSCRDELPRVCAAINPCRHDCDYPFKNLAGVGVVFKLLCALEGSSAAICEQYADIVVVGTIADVMPLIGENRLIACRGLVKLENTQNYGLLALMKSSGLIRSNEEIKRITSGSVGYILAPRINAAGRIANASLAVELLLADNAETAMAIAAELCEINKIRQQTELKMYVEAENQIKTEKNNSAYVLSSRDWHQGVIGIVASRITEKYSRPSVLFTRDGDVYKGSGRSVKNLSIMDALHECRELLSEYGGHDLAAGLTVSAENYDAFKKKFLSYIENNIQSEHQDNILDIDCIVSSDEMTLNNVAQLQAIEPYGLQNPSPVLLMKNLVLKNIIALSDGKHLKLFLSNGINEYTAMYFNITQLEFPVCENEKCDVVFNVEINEYMQKKSLQFVVKDIKLNASTSNDYEDYIKFTNGNDTLKLSDSVVPDINDFRAVFKFLRQEAATEKKRISIRKMQHFLLKKSNTEYGLCKLQIILDILEEKELIEFTTPRWKGNLDLVELRCLPFSGKTDLDTSLILKRLREMI